jgi:ribose transport system substrate-binding protein
MRKSSLSPSLKWAIMFRFLSRIAVALFVLFAPACSGPDSSTPKAGSVGKESGGKISVAIVTNNPAEFWTICEAGAMKGGKDFGANVIFRRPEKQDVALQSKIIDSIVRQGISGIAISVLNPEEQTKDLKNIATKTKLITMDNDASGSDRLCYVGTDNYAAGKAVGKLVKECIPEGGTIAIFVGTLESINGRERFQGVVDELAGEKDAKGPKYGKYELHTNNAITDETDPIKAQDRARTHVGQLAEKPNVCLIGLYAYNPPALLEAVRARGLKGKMKIIGFDEDDQTLDGIESGEIYATVVQDPFNFGYKSVEILVAEAKGDTSKRAKSAVPHRVITKDGIDPTTKAKDRVPAAEFRKNLKEILESAKK